jgi:dienelactone hydrolase
METQFIKGESDLNKLASLYSTQEEWETRASTIRKGILKGAELDPLPPKTPLNATIHSTRFYASYSVANVYFESIPGFFVTGNLYRPLNYQSGAPKPLLLIPHGHFSEGRFEAHNQQLGVMFARMGAIAMTYDMVGKGENTQMEHDTPYALTLQLLNSIRVLDFLLTLENVDTTKIGITGASGGGTQTILLTAVDDRISVSAPVVMVSSWMYGGCACESGLPIHKGEDYATNNAEIAALAAPRPMLIVSCGNDWTQFTPELEYPFIQRIYGFYGAETRVKNVHLPNDEHDFGPAKRFAAYEFMAQNLGLSIQNIMDFEQLFDEATNTIESIDTMRAFDSTHPRPPYALMGVETIMGALKNLQGIEVKEEKTIDSIPAFFFFAISVLSVYCELKIKIKKRE